MFVKREYSGGFVFVGESSEHGVPNEGGAAREREEEEVGVREIAMGGDGAE